MNAGDLLPHLLRPAWLSGLLLLPAIWWLWRRQRNSNPWRRIVDPHLLAHLLESDQATRRAAPWLLLTALTIALIALSGPAWRREDAPVIEPAAPLVIALDLSSAMLAADLPPSRNARMRIKLLQVIAQRRGGQLGLVAYAGAAFTVAPLSDDGHSASELIDALLPSVMPVDGQRADLAIARSAALLKQAGFTRGQILLLSDHADTAALTVASAAAAQGYTTSALAVGTVAGAPVMGSDGFTSDEDGHIRMPRLDAPSLRALATAGGGRYAVMTSQADDLAALDLLDAHGVADEQASHRAGETAMHWRDDGSWLVLVLLPLLLAGFRRGWLAAMVLMLAMMPMPRAQAAGRDWWDGLWQRDEQRAYRAIRQGQPAQASALAQSPLLAAAADYRAGNYPSAAARWSHADNADAHYNRGNALTRMKQYPQAIQAYDRALALQPGMPDATANRTYAQKMLQQQKREQARQKQLDQQQDQQRDHRGNQTGEGQQQGQQQAQQQQVQQQQAQQPGQQSQRDQAGLAPTDTAAQRQRQAQADAATQRALQQALQSRQAQAGERPQDKARVPAESDAQREQRDAIEQWLRKVPDDPGGLLRRKFAIEYQRRQTQGEQ